MIVRPLNKIIFLLSFLSSLNGHCDTLDYYHIYLNDSLIGQFNSVAKNPSIYIKLSELKKNDIITVRYVTDNPCTDCIYVLSVFLEVMEKTPEAESTEISGAMSIPIKELLYFQKKYEIYKFPFVYHIRTDNLINKYWINLFELIFI